MRTLTKPVCAAALSALLTGVVGCSPEISDYCANKVACERGNEYDEDACIEELKSDEDVADVYGCKSAHEGLIQCLNDFSVCMPASSSYELSFTDEYPLDTESSSSDTTAVEPGYFTVPDNSCSAAYDVLDSCMDAVNAYYW